MVVYECGQPLYYQLHQFSAHDRVDRRQPVPVHLLERHVRRGVYSPANCSRRGFDVGGRSRLRLTEPRWVVDAQVRH